MKQLYVLMIGLCSLMLVTCSAGVDQITVAANSEIRYLIGVSQANLSEPWRILMNQEIREEASHHLDMQVVFADASGSNERQIQDIARLRGLGVDLLVVSPNDAIRLAPAIDEAYRHIPVILLDRAVEGYNYTLFIGPDNKLIGERIGRFVASLPALKQKKQPELLEIQGSRGSPPVTDRSSGFRNALRVRTGLEVQDVIVADWLRDRAEDELKVFLAKNGRIPDVIFAQNDHMAFGAWRALPVAARKRVVLVGVDGLPGLDSGLDLVRRGILNATMTCPTGGREAITYARDILDGQPGIPKKVFLNPHLITQINLPPEGPEIVPARSLPGQLISNIKTNASRNGKSHRLVLGFSQPGHESDWRLANAESIKAAANRVGIKLIMTDANQSQTQQIADIRGFIARNVDIIAFSPLISSGWDQVLREARLAGIPVICSDRIVDSDDELYDSFIGSDFFEEGKRAARWLMERMKSQKLVNIVELTGTIGSAPAQDRQNGFRSVIATDHRFHIIASETGDFRRDEGKRVMAEILTKLPGHIDAVFAHNDDMALGAIKAMDEAGMKPGTDVIVVSIDGVRAAFNAMIAGKLNCSVECSPLLGPQLVKVILDWQAGKDLPLRIIADERIFPADSAIGALGSRRY